jgi:hypothetical protein
VTWRVREQVGLGDLEPLANEALVFENLAGNLDIDWEIVGHDQTLLEEVKIEEPQVL